MNVIELHDRLNCFQNYLNMKAKLLNLLKLKWIC